MPEEPIQPTPEQELLATAVEKSIDQYASFLSRALVEGGIGSKNATMFRPGGQEDEHAVVVIAASGKFSDTDLKGLRDAFMRFVQDTKTPEDVIDLAKRVDLLKDDES